MNKKFLIDDINETKESFFDRQQRISWWDQDTLHRAKVLVVGAGAIGNETLKNLALLGIGNIYIVDFDTVSTSNLSRTVLFRKEDCGKLKSEVAACRTKEIALYDGVNVHWFHGDAVWELGTGIFRQMDVVLGCLDNVETRLFVNRQCWLANTPWIDAGIYELGGHVSVFVPPDSSCYQCAVSEQQLQSARKRYSCDDFKRSFLNEGKMPTVQITSALVSAIQVQEALKILCDQEVESGKEIYFQGKINDFDKLNIPKKDNCGGHLSYPEVKQLPLSNSATVREFLQLVSKKSFSDKESVLDLRGDSRSFILSIGCKSCGQEINLNRPNFRIFDDETVCNSCRERDHISSQFTETPATKKIAMEFSLSQTEKAILDMSLWEIGVPQAHIVTVRDYQGNFDYYELSQGTPFSQV